MTYQWPCDTVPRQRYLTNNHAVSALWVSKAVKNLRDAKPNDDEATKNPITHPTLAAEIDRYVKQMDALAETLPLAMMAIGQARTSSRERLNEFLTGECKPYDDGSGKKGYMLEGNQYLRLRKFKNRDQKVALAQLLVPRALFVSLVSVFDAHIGRLIRHLFRVRPEVLSSSANTLTYSQLVEFGTVENARDYVVEKEVETVLRKSHTEQFDWLEAKFGLPLRKDLPAWPTFIEVTERRNLFVHSNGIVSRQYLEVCKRNSCPISQNLCVGGPLSLKGEYFWAAHECLFEIGVKLSQVLWRKVQPDDIKAADGSLVTVCYELLVEGRYQLARILLDFATEILPKYSSDEYRLTFVINRAQAYKWLGNEEKARNILSAEDWTAKANKFKLAQMVLLDDFKAAAEFMRRIGSGEHMDTHAYREWPLFKEARKSKEFADAFEEIFKEPLNTVTVSGEEARPSDKPLLN